MREEGSAHWILMTSTSLTPLRFGSSFSFLLSLTFSSPLFLLSLTLLFHTHFHFKIVHLYPNCFQSREKHRKGRGRERGEESRKEEILFFELRKGNPNAHLQFQFKSIFISILFLFHSPSSHLLHPLSPLSLNSSLASRLHP